MRASYVCCRFACLITFTFMKHNVNLNRADFHLPRLADGKLVTLPVDDFPVRDKSLYKSNGFPCSDIGLLDRFSTDHVDRELFDIVASRCQEISQNPDDGLSDAEKLRLLKPAYVQTASECAHYEEYVYQELGRMRAQKAVEVERSTDKSTTTQEVEVSATPVVANG